MNQSFAQLIRNLPVTIAFSLLMIWCIAGPVEFNLTIYLPIKLLIILVIFIVSVPLIDALVRKKYTVNDAAFIRARPLKWPFSLRRERRFYEVSTPFRLKIASKIGLKNRPTASKIRFYRSFLGIYRPFDFLSSGFRLMIILTSESSFTFCPDSAGHKKNRSGKPERSNSV
ncbi:hypothetical protein ACQKLP_21675 [Chitinophaga sp. NPDC101104]|uniref:hypothetical protein n=1 Tax=Chitinophaga sp. NPDC101104 TaxID=3390561 RepID=UPI003D0937DD